MMHSGHGLYSTYSLRDLGRVDEQARLWKVRPDERRVADRAEAVLQRAHADDVLVAVDEAGRAACSSAAVNLADDVPAVRSPMSTR